jgi:hypothetical protein
VSVMTRRVERDFGWWDLPRTRGGWRLSWEVATGALRLYHHGGEKFVLRLGKFTEAEVDALLGDYGEAPLADAGNLDGRWLARKLPALQAWCLSQGGV